MLGLFKSIAEEVQSFSKLNKSSARARARTYFFIMLVVVNVVLAITLGAVVNNAVLTSEAYVKLKKDYKTLELECHSKNQHSGSSDSGNGLVPKGYWAAKDTETNVTCSDVWCVNETIRKVKQ